MSKAWELLKHLDEGGVLEHQTHQLTRDEVNLYYMVSYPEEYTIVKRLYKHSVEIWGVHCEPSNKLTYIMGVLGLSDWDRLEDGPSESTKTKYRITVEELG